MMEVRTYQHVKDVPNLALAWDRLSEQMERFYPSFAETEQYFEDAGLEHRLYVVLSDEAILGILCFVHEHGVKQFTIGERRLARFRIRVSKLYGSAVLGSVDALTIAEILQRELEQSHFDEISLGEIETASALYDATKRLGAGLKAIRASRKNALHWIIKLPSTYEDYLKSLRSSTRSTLKRKERKFQGSVNYTFQVITATEDVERFLTFGEQISRRTYQWNVGQRLENDRGTRARFLRLAEAGALRCYLLLVDERPCAFLRGEIRGNLYHYETPGFDPDFEKLSPGNVLLMWALKDIIEKTSCRIFDFGTGGDVAGYKASFGNKCSECARIEIVNTRSAYALCLMLVQQLLFLLLNFADATFGGPRLRRMFGGLFRKYG